MSARQVLEAVYGSTSELFREPADASLEFIVSSAVRDPESGDVYLGAGHADAREVADRYTNWDSFEDGFWTNRKRFVTRREAMQIARANHQRQEIPLAHKEKLDSAELRPEWVGR